MTVYYCEKCKKHRGIHRAHICGECYHLLSKIELNIEMKSCSFEKFKEVVLHQMADATGIPYEILIKSRDNDIPSEKEIDEYFYEFLPENRYRK